MKRRHDIRISITCDDSKFKEALMQELKYIMIGPDMDKWYGGSHGGYCAVSDVSTGHDHKISPRDEPPVLSAYYGDEDDDDYDDFWD